MKEEDILDSDQIEKYSEDDYVQRIPALELQENLGTEIEWTPLISSIESNRFYRLMHVDGETIKWAGSIGVYILSLLFLMPLGLLGLSSSFTDGSNFLFLFYGIFFLGTGLMFIEYYSIPLVFNKRNGLFYKPRRSLFVKLMMMKWVNSFLEKKYTSFYSKYYKPILSKNTLSVKLKDIKAIQVLRKEDKMEDSVLYSYELNLILQNHQRWNIVAQLSDFEVLKDAQTLANFLDVPLLRWDKRKELNHQ